MEKLVSRELGVGIAIATWSFLVGLVCGVLSLWWERR